MTFRAKPFFASILNLLATAKIDSILNRQHLTAASMSANVCFWYFSNLEVQKVVEHEPPSVET